MSLTTPIGDQVALRVRAGVFQRILEAHLAPVGVAHLEDPALRDLVERAQDPGAIGPRMAVVGLINRWMLRLGGVGGILLVALFNWWAGLLLALVLIYGVRRMRIAQVDIAALTSSKTASCAVRITCEILLLVPGAEKEVRVFGLARWLRDRFQAEWEEAMARVWRRRRSSVRDAVLAIGPVLLVASGVVALAVHDALSGSIAASELLVVLQAVLAALACATIQVSDSLVALGVATLEATIALEDALAGRAEPLGLLPATGLPEREVRFDGVRYSYPGQPRDILKAVDLVIPAGKSLAIVGENGAGKTTLIKLLARLVRADWRSDPCRRRGAQRHRPPGLAAALCRRVPGVHPLSVVGGREHRAATKTPTRAGSSRPRYRPGHSSWSRPSPTGGTPAYRDSSAALTCPAVNGNASR